MVIGGADASHTFKKGGYKMTVSNKEYEKLKNTDCGYIYKKVGYKKYKVKYVSGHKKVKTYKKKYAGVKKVVTCNTYWDSKKKTIKRAKNRYLQLMKQGYILGNIGYKVNYFTGEMRVYVKVYKKVKTYKKIPVYKL